MSAPFRFTLEATDPATGARAGRFETPRGTILTPAFMPVGTQATVKSLTPDDLRDLGAQIILGNTYHLHLRPGDDLIERLGGLHRFMGWDGPILTDSGGFQVFSLAHLRKLTEEGVAFRSHIDGSPRLLTPEVATQIQARLGSDIAMAFDHCVELPATYEKTREAMERTHRWLDRCLDAHDRPDQALFPIVQGGTFDDLRIESAEVIGAYDAPGFAIGGVSVGETKADARRIVELVAPRLPRDRPRYLMGVGSPEDLVNGVAGGVDLFDCVLPTRIARNGTVLTDAGRVTLTRGGLREVDAPIEATCDCYTCRHFSLAYLHHLFKAEELLGHRLASIHNLRYMARLGTRMRQAIIDGTYGAWRDTFLAGYRVADEAVAQAQRERRVAAWQAARPALDARVGAVVGADAGGSGR
jgi:queuine tRNA-ribosyltransferase